MPPTTIAKISSDPKDQDKQKKVVDHTVSDLGSIPAPSQAVVLASSTPHPHASWTRIFTAISLAALLLPAIYLRSFFQPAELPINPTDYAARTKLALSQTPIIDGHNDLPYLIRVELQNKIYDGFDLKHKFLGHTDIQRMRTGQVGRQFWSCYVQCPGVNDPELYKQENLDQHTWIVRDTLEQIDVTKRLIAEHPEDLRYCDNPKCIRDAFKLGKVASMIGIEVRYTGKYFAHLQEAENQNQGGHQMGSSLAAIRQFFNPGARYITTNHNCDNAFATAASTVAAGGEDHGLTPFGHEYVKEMNRLGMMIDLSHTLHQIMRDVLSLTRSPIIFSHSGAYSVQKHLRHVPDDVLRSVKRNGGIVMVTFVCRFLNMQHPELASIYDVVDHILYIANLIGWEHVGVGSDFSGTPGAPIGLEDVSKYPDLVALLMARGATDEQVKLFAGENLIRVWENIEAAAKVVQTWGEKPDEDIWEGRTGSMDIRLCLSCLLEAEKSSPVLRGHINST